MKRALLCGCCLLLACCHTDPDPVYHDPCDPAFYNGRHADGEALYFRGKIVKGRSHSGFVLTHDSCANLRGIPLDHVPAGILDMFDRSSNRNPAATGRFAVEGDFKVKLRRDRSGGSLAHWLGTDRYQTSEIDQR
jgi:hypothetical protein